MKNIARISCALLVALIIGISFSAKAQFLDKLIKQVTAPAVPVLHNLFPNTSEQLLSQTDEAKKAEEKGLMSATEMADFKAKLNAGSSVDYFRDMDYGVTKRPAELQKVLSAYIPGISEKEAVDRMARGRNNWMVWTFGNDKFWTDLGRSTFGGLDFLKTLSSHPNLPSSRSNRWKTLGLVNEPCFKESSDKPADPWGLRLDERLSTCDPDPFADEKAYPGLKIGSRGKTLKYKGKEIQFPVGSFYGYPSGVIGFRIFPNPDFDQKAADAWDADRFYNDPKYFNDPNLVRPYRVGVSCALCHVGPNPSRPPDDFNAPTFANLNSNPGAQYFWVDRIFMWNWKKMPAAKFPDSQDNFVFQLIHTSRPGALDTSLVSSDQINNPRTMNAVYDLPARITAGVKFNSIERLTGDEKRNKQFRGLPSSVIPNNSLLRSTSYDSNGDQFVISPRVLKDGSDSVGALGALNRVYVNIGLFSEEWVRHFIPLIGGPALTPFPIKVAEQNSLYWQANVQQTPDLALFFLASAKPDKLSEAPNGQKYLKDFDGPEVTLGKKVFAENCAACHSSKVPDKGYSYFNNPKNPTQCHGENYMQCWEAYWNYTKSPEFKNDMLKIVDQKDFLDSNFLSTDLRVPVNLTDSQLCSPIGTNAIKGDIWDNFSSTSYKELDSIGTFTVNYPLDNGSRMTSQKIEVPGGGRGYLRPPSLISVWSTAPFLQNNTLGLFDDRGSVEGRIRSFNDSINKLLNPDQRANPMSPKVSGMDTKAVFYKTNDGFELPGDIDVTPQVTYIKIPRGYVPDYLYQIIKAANLGNPVSKIPFEKKGFQYTVFPILRDEPIVAEGKDKTKKVAKRDVANDYGLAAMMDPNLMGNDLFIGPIPAGVPVNLISNLDLEPSPLKLVKLNRAIFNLTRAVVQTRNKQGAEALREFMRIASSSLVEASKCSDMVVTRGHYFGSKYDPRAKEWGTTGLSPEEKSALIEYIKYF